MRTYRIAGIVDIETDIETVRIRPELVGEYKNLSEAKKQYMKENPTARNIKKA